ncbi:type VI secretion system Vgr family protein [Pseudomonas frederiksbergensis]|uniref:Type IV secretion protein Rhs n=1 Tax=Pseudomonas frederiksbergensis TaxID=104087 RepID=A0A423KFA0_9PSED|nr:type VI secretion system tip protein VgrG [Pseudomonas frederiksbergensis]RON51536.1 type IV secretion protein Rhs [Pseudomonas frederiksbergensis]
MPNGLQTFFDHSRHTLNVRNVEARLDVLTFEGEERLSQPFIYRVEFTCTERDLPADALLGQDASFSLHAAPQTVPLTGLSTPEVKPLRTLHGVVTGFKRQSGSNDEACYQITLQPRLALLDRGQQFRLYQHQSVPEIVESILRSRHGFEGQDFLFRLQRNYPKREQVMQYGESDLSFIARLLAEVGIWYRFTSDERLSIDVVEFCDDQRHYQFDVELPYRPQSGLVSSGQDAVWQLQSSYKVVEQQVHIRAYQHRDASAHLSGAIDQSRGATTTYGEAYHYAEPYRVLGDAQAQDEDLQSESGYFFARLRHERYLNDQARLSGISSSAILTPGQVLNVSGGAPQAFTPGAVITCLSTRAARDSSFEATFQAMPYSETVCFRPALLPKPQIAGTVPARVTSPQANDPYAHIDLEGRYRVNFLFDRDTWKPGEESLWLRLARPYAGDTHGLHLPLIPGTEVAIAFEQGDPDRPYIAHALHDSQHVDHVTLRNYKRNVLRTPANNKLRMDDTRGQEHVKLSTEHSGKSQLNLGHLVDAERKKRGEGFELRTDGWGTVRGGKGLFISADAQSKAQGQALEMAAAIGRLQKAGDQLEGLSSDAQAAHATPACVQAQVTFMREQLDELKAAVLLLSAPQGMALTSGKHLQLAAQDNLMINAGADADISVVKKLFMGVGQGLSLFVRKLGIKLIANQGPVKVQAQNDTLELMARHGLEIISTEDEIRIVAKKKIILNAGGSYITLDQSGIESGTLGDYNIKSAHFDYLGPASMGASHPEYPQSLSKQPLRFSVPQTPNASSQGWTGMPYTLYADGAVLKQGVLDKTGQVLIDHEVVTQQYRMEMANGVSYQIPVPSDYRNAEQATLANGGLHNHLSQTDTEVSQPTSHTDQRALYAAVMSVINDQEGKIS